MYAEAHEFRKIWIGSALAHLILVAVTLMTNSISTSRIFLEPQGQKGPLNVIWASTVQSPPPTALNKLPAPMVEPQVAPETKAAQPKVVMPENARKSQERKTETKELDAEARRRAMADAIASLKTSTEIRPTPKPENFPSVPGAEKSKSGLPAGPTNGVEGILGGDPHFAAYKTQLQKVLSDNLVWLQKGAWQVQVTFRMDEKGNVIDPKLAKSSGNISFDNAALRAIKKSSPLPTPPPQLTQQIVGEEITINFKPNNR